MKKKILIIGTGMDGAETMTAAGMKAVEASDVIIGAERVVKPFEAIGKPLFVSYKTAEIFEYIQSCEHEKIAVLMSGDCGFFSGAEKLLPLLGEYDTDVVCGISSPVYFCSKIGIPWQEMKFVSLHGADGNIARNVSANKYTFFLLGGDIVPKDVCKRLCEYGLSDVSLHIGENLAYKNERIISGKASNFTDILTENLCVVAVISPESETHIKSCIPDGEFIRADKIPITKAEVRGVCVSMLEVGQKSVCWDIGGGTGSVAVEMALRCTDGKVFSVEKNAAACSLIDSNRRKFRCDNIEIIGGNAEDLVENLPVPDCVFIGGSGGHIEKMIKTAHLKNPSANIVLTAISLETLNESISVFDKLPIKTEVTQIAVTRTKKVGEHTMLSAENPVFIIKGAAE